VRRLLGGITGTDGLGQRFEGILTPVSGTGGLIATRLTTEDSLLSRLASDLVRFDDRMGRREDALNKQWSALETALAKAQSRTSDISGLSQS
jgi:flagellar hook-associated protein 2